MWYREFYPRSRPRQAKGGIKAQSKRGAFGTSWWAKRWIAVLESFNIGARLGRGRSYARNGQVLSIDVARGKVKATVQGSMSRPYDVNIAVQSLTAADWKKLAKSLAGQALFAAKLLAGEMPQDIEQAFTGVGLSLFPEKLRDLTTACSCPDYSNPCKHIAAVYYLLGEEFDRDPFLLFKLRGLSREELVQQLTEAGVSKKPSGQSASAEEEVPAPAAEPLAADPAVFWNGGSLPEDFFGEVQVSPVPAALPKRLGNFPFWRGAERFLDAIEPVYQEAAERGLNVFLGEKDRGPGAG
jgi:uncharacterized Zn finger protein